MGRCDELITTEEAPLPDPSAYLEFTIDFKEVDETEECYDYAGTFMYSTPSLNLTTYTYTVDISNFDMKPSDTLSFLSASYDLLLQYVGGEKVPEQSEFASSNGFWLYVESKPEDPDNAKIYSGAQIFIILNECPSQYYMDDTNYCLSCPLGSTTSSNRRSCVDCPPNNYWVNGECIECGYGMISGPLAQSKDECFNPTSNVFISFASFVFSLLLCLIYILRGRFQRVAFARRYRVNKPLLRGYNRIFGLLERKRQSSVFNEKSRWDTSTRFKKGLGFILFIVCSLVAMFVCILTFTLSTLGAVAFKSLLLVRALKVDIDIIQTLNNFFSDLADAIGMPFIFDIMKTFTSILAFFNHFEIDIGQIGVTCLGLQAPGWLRFFFFFL